MTFPSRLVRGLALALVVVGVWASASSAGEVRFPLTVDYEMLRIAIRKHLHEDAGGQLTVRASADGCRTLTVRELTMYPAGGRLRIATRASARVGFGFLGWCWAHTSWEGHLDVTARPEIDRSWTLRIHELDAQLYDVNRQQGGVSERIFDLAKGWAESELATFTFDLGPPVQEIKALLGAFATPSRAAPVATALATLRPVGVAVDNDAVRVFVALDVPPVSPAPRTPEPPPGPAELERWQASLDGWDGFLGFVAKDLGGAVQDPGVRNDVLDLLLDARHVVSSALEQGPEAGPDPIRRLFLEVWERLRAIVRRVATQGGTETRALRFFAFLAAGDALAAIEAAAPATGFEISIDGLRQLARALDPDYRGDPVDAPETLDPSLREIFRFRDPDAPPRRGRRSKPSGSWWLGPRPAYADASDDEWTVLARRLDRWVPTREEMGNYRDTVDRLLTVAADRAIDPDALDERFDDLFYQLVKTTAWQESCWRQFVRRGGRVAPLASRTNDVGMMQINRRVWRGFFNVQKLSWNAAYNVGAGTEILLQLLARYGQREATERLENAARATYSAYNGGPRRYRRYRAVRPYPADRGFWEKYQLVAAGAADHLVLCTRG